MRYQRIPNVYLPAEVRMCGAVVDIETPYSKEEFIMEQYNVTGMSCAACSARVEKAVN